ncbi:MFS transporter [Streptomyces sp. L2]|uniref:MFS transporter n=1 Tax=Streptomyces sp. L2 TaxID=2162665 RepID=UPI00101034A5|nr:MFS transporter [Streptomyces sp. L2]
MVEPQPRTAPRPDTAGPPPDPRAGRRRAWPVAALIVAFMLVNYADKSVLGLAAVPVMDELHISNSTYGLISSSFALLFSLSGLLVGFVSARVSCRVLLFAMAAVWAVAQLPVVFVASVPALVAGRVLLGAAEGPAASMSMHALYKWFPEDRRGLPSALQISGAALGTLIAAPVVTWLIGAFGWRSAFAALAVTSAVWSLLWWRTGHDGPYGHEPAHRAHPAHGAASDNTPGTRPGTAPDAHAGASDTGPGTGPGAASCAGPGTASCAGPGTASGTGPGTASGTGPGTASGTGPGTASGTGPGTEPGTASGTGPGTASGTGPGTASGTDPATRLPYRRLLLNGTVLGSVAGAFGASWALALSQAWLPAYLRTQLGMSPGGAATFISGVSAFSFVLLLTVSPLVDALKRRGVSSRWSSGAPQGVAVTVAGLAMAVFPFADARAPLLALLAVAFGAHAVAFPLHYMTTAAVVPPAQRGAVFGIVAATGTLPGLIAPYLTGRLLDSAPAQSTGYTHAFLLSAAVILVCGLVALTAIRPERDVRRLGAMG